jgi:hypothetical protein
VNRGVIIMLDIHRCRPRLGQEARTQPYGLDPEAQIWSNCAVFGALGRHSLFAKLPLGPMIASPPQQMVAQDTFLDR